MYSPIQIVDFSLSFPHKVCFEGFSTQISFGDRIAIIGRNGEGKSSLLKMIAEKNADISCAYIPQIIDAFDSLSGGERFNKSLSQALGENPSLLLLDEPTNHLDLQNRKSLMRMLKSYCGTLIVVTHDKELLRNCVDILWHIDGGKIRIFHGNYDDYMDEASLKRQSISHQMELLEREKKATHKSLMREQERASKSKAIGEKKVATGKWMKCVGDLKGMKAEKSQGSKLKSIDDKKQKLSKQLAEIRLPEIIVPKFHLSHRDVADRTIVSIVDGAVGYRILESPSPQPSPARGEGEVAHFSKPPLPSRERVGVRGQLATTILENLNFSLASRGRVAIFGNNGSGKTTLVKAILGDESVAKSGEWTALNPKDIGYLDQHYKNLDQEKSSVEIISEANSLWSYAEVRKHLNDFLFRKNEEANALVKNLSGGEKARLSLAKIAANPPKLLILDEVTNNIDLETRDHMVEILREYPAAMIIISHDETFLDEIGVEKWNIKQ